MNADTSMSFDSAEKYCEDVKGGNLASLSNVKDYNLAVKLASKSNPYLTWVGLQLNSQGSLLWTDGSPVNYTNFLNGEPDLSIPSCFALKSTTTSTGIVPLDCKYNQPFLCKQHAAECPPSKVLGSTGLISSANYLLGINYDNNLGCMIYLVAPAGSRTYLNFSNFQTEAVNDYLEIWDGPDANQGSLLRNFSGTINDTDANYIYSSGSPMTLRFITNNVIVAKGWKAFFASPKLAGPISVSGTGGLIMSPSFPSYYGVNQGQFYNIAGPAGSKILLTFTAFDTSSNDYLAVYDGTTTVVLIRKLSGDLYLSDKTPLTFRSTGNSVTMFFYSSNQVTQNQGWSMEWSVVY
uniref:C-type LECtin n=1 Tax=Rhabditophanes sp. KR3021 TaxID=114890 RepID=A0AC35TV16_9BILA